MKSIITCILVFYICLVTACKTENANNNHSTSGKSQSLPTIKNAPADYQKTVEVYDYAHKHFEAVPPLQKQLREYLQMYAGEAATSKTATEIRMALSELNKSEHVLSQWKSQYNTKFDTIKNQNAREVYLINQRIEMEQIRDQVMWSIKEGEKMVAKMKNEPKTN